MRGGRGYLRQTKCEEKVNLGRIRGGMRHKRGDMRGDMSQIRVEMSTFVCLRRILITNKDARIHIHGSICVGSDSQSSFVHFS